MDQFAGESAHPTRSQDDSRTRATPRNASKAQPSRSYVIPCATNFRDAIMDKIVFTQTYFENTFNVTEGDFASGLLHPGQMWDKRPVKGWANYRTPIENLFMCGSACHPGPGVTCVPGYNGAREVLKELK